MADQFLILISSSGVVTTLYHFHKRTESTLFTYLLSPFRRHTYYKNVDWLNWFHVHASTVAKINIFESIQDLPPPPPSILSVLLKIMDGS